MKTSKKVSLGNKKPKLTLVFRLTEESIKIWWKNLDKFIGVYLWGFLFSLIPLMAVIIIHGLFNLLNLGGTSNLGLIIISVLGGAVALYFYIRTYMALFLLVKNNYKGKELDVFKSTYRQFWSYLGLVLLTTIFILLWSLLLIIPGIIFSVFYSLAVYVFFFEDKKGMAAVRRSIQLVKGYWWPVFGRFLFLGALLWIFTMIISAPLSAAPENGTFAIIWNGIVQIISFLVGPISLLFGYHIYKDLAKIKKNETKDK